jgi:FeS assembly SUF system protein
MDEFQMDELQNGSEQEHGEPATADKGQSGSTIADTGLNAIVIEAQVIEAIETCYDPEIPVNIYELGLIYDVAVKPSGEVNIRMTLTAPSCPAAQSLPSEVERKVRAVPGVTDVTVDVVWDPAWTMEMMSEAAKFKLGFL